tara:strand:+ start:557 stop:862 length:306 start_codon:yes stop_codon:yes gene_type:complete
MSRKRKKIIKQLNELETQFVSTQHKMKTKQYAIVRFYKKYSMLVISGFGLLSVVLLYANRSKMNVKQVRQYTGFLIMTIYTSIQANILKALLNKGFETIKK